MKRYFFRPMQGSRSMRLFQQSLLALGVGWFAAQIERGVLHQSGFLHASGSCGAQSQLSEAWPPDLRGRLQGIGLDRRTGSGPTPGTYAIVADESEPGDAYDVMSYCAHGKAAWLSPRYWSRFGKGYTASLRMSPA